jgi:hypothetical protein
VLIKELHECRVRDAQNGILAALVRPSRSAFSAEIEYTRPTFEKADDLLGGNLQLLRDFGGRSIPPVQVAVQYQDCPEDDCGSPPNALGGKGLDVIVVFFDLKSDRSKRTA